MHTTCLTINLTLIVLGLIGLALNFYVALMWIIIIIAALGAIWGWLIETPKRSNSWRT